jgi:hypothetical protein
MKVNELRIGNWFIPFMFNGEELEARPIRAMEFLALSQNPHWGKPIPLTEEWLLKFGFDDLGTYGYGRGNFHICLHENEFYFPINNRKVFIKHVHQLQNLYFALTGEELTIDKKC